MQISVAKPARNQGSPGFDYLCSWFLLPLCNQRLLCHHGRWGAQNWPPQLCQSQTDVRSLCLWNTWEMHLIQLRTVIHIKHFRRKEINISLVPNLLGKILQGVRKRGWNCLPTPANNELAPWHIKDWDCLQLSHLPTRVQAGIFIP